MNESILWMRSALACENNERKSNRMKVETDLVVVHFHADETDLVLDVANCVSHRDGEGSCANEVRDLRRKMGGEMSREISLGGGSVGSDELVRRQSAVSRKARSK